MPDCNDMPGKESRQSRWKRQEATPILVDFETARKQGISQRQFAEQAQVPRTTLQHWLARKQSLDEDPVVVEFLESPQGLAFIHRLVVAAHHCFEQMSPAGLRPLCLFLRLSHLDRVVAASYGAQQALAQMMRDGIIEFGQQEHIRLARGMQPRSINLCEDETFHPEVCLVAIEPVSGFIVVERYSDKRSAQSWSDAVKEGLGEMPLEVVQVTSDQAKGIVAQVQNELGAHSSPDLFHVQHEVSKAASLPLATAVRNRLEQLEAARDKKQKLETKLSTRKPGSSELRARRLTESLERAAQAQQTAQVLLEEAAQRQEQMRGAIRGLSEAYHPYHLEQATPRDESVLEAELEAHFEQMDTVAQEASLSQKSRQRIAKARRVVPLMVATMAFFWQQVRRWLTQLALEAEFEEVVHHQLIAGFYLKLVAEKSSEPDERDRLHDRARRLLARARAPNGALAALQPARREAIEKVARQCAELFQRSSSCVEGRNGRLELWHRSLHRLSESKLRALTVLHNFFIQRADGTTAAERFYGAPPRDLFEWLLDRVAVPARPAARRTRRASQVA